MFDLQLWQKTRRFVIKDFENLCFFYWRHLNWTFDFQNSDEYETIFETVFVIILKNAFQKYVNSTIANFDSLSAYTTKSHHRLSHEMFWNYWTLRFQNRENLIFRQTKIKFSVDFKFIFYMFYKIQKQRIKIKRSKYQ